MLFFVALRLRIFHEFIGYNNKCGGETKMNKIHEHIKAFRKAQGLTQEEVAQKLFVTRQLISKWEQGKSLPDILSVEKLSNLFGVSIHELIDDESVKSITLKEAISNQKKSRILTLSIMMSVIAIVGTIIGLLLSRRYVVREEVFIERYYYITEIDNENQLYTFTSESILTMIEKRTHTFRESQIFLNITDQKGEPISISDLKVNDKIKVSHNMKGTSVSSIQVIDSAVEISLYGIFIADSSLEFDDLNDIKNTYQGVRYIEFGENGGGGNVHWQFSSNWEEYYIEHIYSFDLLINPLEVQNELRVGLVTSAGIEYVDTIDLITASSYTYKGEFEIDSSNFDEVDSINVEYRFQVTFINSFETITVYEYDKNHNLVAESVISDYGQIRLHELNDETLYAYIKTTTLHQRCDSTIYEKDVVELVFVGENRMVYTSDQYGFVSEYYYRLD